MLVTAAAGKGGTLVPLLIAAVMLAWIALSHYGWHKNGRFVLIPSNNPYARDRLSKDIRALYALDAIRVAVAVAFVIVAFA
jgi:hypothetical protein